MSADKTTKTRRAIGIARQSNGDGESVAQQVARIEEACERDGLDWSTSSPSRTCPGGTPLSKRAGLRRAIEAVEAGEANVIIGAYFDRLMRSLKVQAELVERVERGGRAGARAGHRAADKRQRRPVAQRDMLGAVAEYHSRTTAERTAGAIQAAIDRGVPPWPRVTPGYRRRDDGTYEPTEHRRRGRRRLRAARRGRDVGEVRERLQAQGVELSYAATTRLLSNRAVLGEIHYGELPPEPRGLRPDRRARPLPGGAGGPGAGGAPREVRPAARAPERAALRLVRRADVGEHRAWRPLAAVPLRRACRRRLPAKTTIGAELVEGLVAVAVKARLAGMKGRASARARSREAQAELERAQAELDALIALLDPLEPAAAERLAKATARRDDRASTPTVSPPRATSSRSESTTGSGCHSPPAAGSSARRSRPSRSPRGAGPTG